MYRDENDQPEANSSSDPHSPLDLADSGTATVDEDYDGNDNNDDFDVDATVDQSKTTTTNSRSKHSKWLTFPLNCLLKCYKNNSFVILVALAILLAYAYPPLGAIYLYPHITASWIAIVFIFVMAGLRLKTEEFRQACKSVRFNIFAQIFNFGVVSSIVFGISRMLFMVGAIGRPLADGMVLCSCLPLTMNTVVVLSKSSGGDEALAVFNAAMGNIIGVFLTPALILGYLGVDGNVSVQDVILKLGLRILLPLVVGQLLRKCFPSLVVFVSNHAKQFRVIQELCLVYIVYTIFCSTFLNQTAVSDGAVMIMVVVQLGLLILVMAIAWVALHFAFHDQPRLRATGIFVCTHKTMGMGIPLINALYEDNPNVGLYTLPLLVWHPMQLLVGTFLSPRIARFVEKEKKRLSVERNEDRNDEEAVEL